MDVSIRIIGDHLVHKIQKLSSSSAFVMSGFDLADGHIESGKQGRGAMTFVSVIKPSESFAVGKPQPALGTLQGLDVGLFIHAKHHSIVRRVQIEPNQSPGGSTLG